MIRRWTHGPEWCCGDEAEEDGDGFGAGTDDEAGAGEVRPDAGGVWPGGEVLPPPPGGPVVGPPGGPTVG